MEGEREWEEKEVDLESIDYAAILLFYMSNRDSPNRDSNHKRKRIAFKSEILINWLSKHKNAPYPTQLEKDELVSASGLAKTQIENWFANVRRRKLKRKSYKRPKKNTVSSNVLYLNKL